MDVIVVGLGAMGSAAVHQLARRGVDVLGIDRHSPPHTYGSSHGETRITRRLTLEGAEYAPLAVRSHDWWRRIEAESGASVLTACGVLNLADRAAGPEVFAVHERAAAAHGIDYELLDAAALRDRYPQFRVADTRVGLLEPGGGFVRPEAAISAQLDLAQRYGAQLHRGERVLAVEASASAVTVRTDAAAYTADQVVLCAGGWLAGLLDDPRLARLFGVYRQVLHWFAVEGAGQDFSPERFPTFIWNGVSRADDYFYGFPSVDGATVKVATGQLDHRTADPDMLDRTVTADEAAGFHRAMISGRLPGVSARAARSQVCMYTVTPDEAFVIDRLPGRERVLIASPCSGHGFKHSAAIGEALAELVTDGATTLDLTPFALGRFTR
ncbi:N-methyl-L-tryptophan oxidase [Streptomyces sp. SID8499]|uniref:N-methyl-L-tryptophan oxidase n=1 Tax=Streptomyces sp. SID8499 TaxID=2706106 RepID=UPI0013CB16DC|nr:N-methyl-L-tryptophan oxidase [Streptomyces sp. SID8499]NED37150.1 N-methyl-L-tryptophan oxidase [Streptomyces sp. SID8499]